MDCIVFLRRNKNKRIENKSSFRINKRLYGVFVGSFVFWRAKHLKNVIKIWYNMDMIWFIVIGILFIIVFLLSLWTYKMAFYSPKKLRATFEELPKGEQYERERERMLSLIREMQALPFERVEITSYDGKKLFGRYYHVKDGAPLQLQFHGYKGSAVRDFCGGNKIAREMGHNSLVIEQRAHGESEGHTITFGIKERRDCLSWIEYANRRFGEDTTVYLSGVSMGAATVLMASQLQLPKNVKGIIADSPYSSPEALIRKVCKEMGYPPKLAFPFLQLGSRVFGGFNLREASAKEAVKHTNIPILLIHGEEDLFVPCEMSKEIYEYCASRENVTFVTFPKAGHGISYIVDEERYVRILHGFLAGVSHEEKEDRLL